MASQAGVGNAAVVHMLRRGGHSGTEERRQHSAGWDHPSTEQAAPSVQRSAVHNVLRAPGRPMDDATRTDNGAGLKVSDPILRFRRGSRHS